MAWTAFGVTGTELSSGTTFENIRVSGADVAFEMDSGDQKIINCYAPTNNTKAVQAGVAFSGNIAGVFIANCEFGFADIDLGGDVERLEIVNTNCGAIYATDGKDFDIDIQVSHAGALDYPVDLVGVLGLILKTSHGGTSPFAIHLDTVDQFLLSGLVSEANEHGVFLEDCTNGEDAVWVFGASTGTDLGFQGKRYTGVCRNVRMAGGVKHMGAGVTNHPNYGAQVDASCENIEVACHLDEAGDTGPINNLAGFEVWTHAKVSLEAPGGGDVLVYDSTEEMYRPDDGSGIGGGVGVGTLVSQLAMASFGGELSVYSGTFRMVFPVNATIVGVTVAVGVAPTGADVIIDVHKNGTTIFTTQANRPTIAATTNISSHEVPDVTAVSAGQYLTFDIDQIGSTLPGEDLTVIVEWRMA